MYAPPRPFSTFWCRMFVLCDLAFPNPALGPQSPPPNPFPFPLLYL